MIDLKKDDDVFILTMDAGENRWNTNFVREVDRALDEIAGTSGPAALVTRSANEKFFSNGLDLDWVNDPEAHPAGGDLRVFGQEFMAQMGRIITLPVPTVCAINGHAFGAGFMVSLCHDVRMMREDRGFICANEMQLGLSIPKPELALFRHKLPANTFYETVQLARRWTGPQALAAGIVQQTSNLEGLFPDAVAKAQELAPLAANREVFGGQKERIFGENAILNNAHGAAHLLRNSEDYKG
jgi:enoyl-CoA hydratase/carnithine racemase